MKSWKDLVGPQASHRCTPITFSEGCLTVSVNNATLRSTLEMQKSKILEKLKTLPNCQNAQRIHFQAGWVAPPCLSCRLSIHSGGMEQLTSIISEALLLRIGFPMSTWMRHFITSIDSIQLCVCQHALDAPLESSAGLGSLLWRTPSALGGGFGWFFKKYRILMMILNIQIFVFNV